MKRVVFKEMMASFAEFRLIIIALKLQEKNKLARPRQNPFCFHVAYAKIVTILQSLAIYCYKSL